MSLIVRESGLMSLLVDGGRPRSRSLGIPLGGAADRSAIALGNALVGNPLGTLALEVTLVGPTLTAIQPAACVVFGASFKLTIDGTPIASGTTFTLEQGKSLRVGATATAVRGYLCVAGGFESRVILDSRSGLEPVKTGDELICRASRIDSRAIPFHTSEGEQPAQRNPSELRVLDGPQRDWFTDESFFAQVFEVSPESNRMGLRLRGVPLVRRPGELLSEAVAPGAVQITNDGLPIVLGVDGQTIGGYPKIAHVVRADLDQLAQLRPGDSVRFTRVSPDEAEMAARIRAAFLKKWLTRLNIADRQPHFLSNPRDG
jgi:5-oxoprolinase (ATP-hydrolysing) subunit C